MRIEVPYGNGTMAAECPENAAVQIIDPVSAKPDKTEEALIEAALDHPIGTARLEQLVQRNTKVTVIVNDHTRPGPNAQMVASVMRRLHLAGISDEQVKVVIATGSHRAPTEAELVSLLGSKYASELEIHSHDCLDEKQNVYIGDTSSGMPIWIDKNVAEAEFIISTGLIAPHHAAGFSGGRKSILPGVAGIQTLRIHHSLPIRPFEPAMGYYEDNPFHMVALEAAEKVNLGFILNVVQDVKKQTIACVAGEVNAAHQAGVTICRESNTVEVSGLADVVIASPGGYPRDCNLYQAQKALSVAEVFGKQKECTFILCAEASDGIGEGHFKEWLEEAATPQSVIERFIREGFNVGNNKAFMFARALTKGRVIIVSDRLDEKELNKMMLSWVPDLQTAVNQVCAGKEQLRMIVLPRAVNIIPHVMN